MKLEKETIFKLVGSSLTIVTIILGIAQYKGTQRYNAKMEFLGSDNKRQVEAYTNLCNSLGKIVSASKNPKEFDKYYKEFISIYYGDIILIEDSVIERMMKELRFYLEEFNFSNQDDLYIKTHIKDLADSCRVSIEKKRSELINEITQN